MAKNTQNDITRVIKEELQKTGRIRENNEPIENIKITNDHAFYKLICEKEAHSDLSSEEFNLLYNEISEKMISRPFTIKEINDFCTQKNIKTFSLEELLSLVPREVSECYVDYENNSVKDHNHGYIGTEIKIKASYQNADLVQDNNDQGYITDSDSYYKFIYNKMVEGNIRSWVLQNLGNSKEEEQNMRDHLTNNSSITDKVLRNWVRDNPDGDLKAWLSDSANKGYTREEYNALYEKISEELVHTSMSINTIKNIYKKYNITPPTDEEFDMLKDKQSETRSFDYWENKTGLPFQGRINLKVTDEDNEEFNLNIDLFQDKSFKNNFDENGSINNIQFLSSLEKTVQTFYDFFGIKKDNNPLLVDGNLANFRLFLFDDHESYTKHLGTQYSGQIPGGGLAESSDNNYISNLYSHADNAHSDFNHDQKSDYQDYNYVIKHELVHGLTFYLTSKLDLGKVLMEGLAEYVTLLTEGKKASDFANLVDDKFRNMSLKEIIRGEVDPYKTGAAVIAYLEETYPNFIDNLLYAATQDRKTLNGRFYFKEMMKKIYESEEKMGFSNWIEKKLELTAVEYKEQCSSDEPELKENNEDIKQNKIPDGTFGYPGASESSKEKNIVKEKMYFSREIESSPKNESNQMEADVNGQYIVGLIYQNGNKVDAIETLIKKGANLVVQNNRGEIPLDIAITEGKIEVAKLLIDYSKNLNHVSESGYSSLHYAILHKQQEIAEYLIHSGKIDLNSQISPKDQQFSGKTPLHLAILTGDMEIIKLLVEKNVDINIKDAKGTTPFMETFSYNGNVEAAKYLLNHGANIDGIEPLMYNNIESEFAELLIKKGANVNYQDSYGHTPLHVAAYNGDLDKCKLLLKHGAILESASNVGRTPLMEAVSGGKIETIKYLIEEKNANVNVQMSDGYTSLHKAVVIGNLGIVKFLINHGAQLEVYNNCGISPLALAKNMGQQEIVDYIDTVIVSAIQHDEKFSVDQISVNIRHNLSDYTAIKEVESTVKNTIEQFKEAFNITPSSDREINIYVFENRDRWASYVKKVVQKTTDKVLGLSKMVDEGKGADIYIYIDHRGNIIKDTLEHEIGHAMNFINLINFDHLIPQAMHEAIANYMEGRENNESSNTFMDREALLEIKDKSLMLDEILRKNLVGNYYYSEAEQVIKFLEDKHPSLIDDLFKKLSIMNNSSTDFKEYSQDEAGKVMTDFFNQLKSYRSEFRDWVEEEIKSQYDGQKGHQSSDRVSRNIKVDVQPEYERSESIILKDTILKIERSCDNDLQGKCEAKLIIDYSTMKSLYDQAEGIDKQTVLEFWHKLHSLDYKIGTLPQEKYYFKDGQFFINNTETNRSIVLPENEVSIKIMKSNENCNLVILNARGDIINHVNIINDINDELLSSLTDANSEIANNIDLINYNTEYYLDIINNDFGGKIYDSHEDVYLF